MEIALDADDVVLDFCGNLVNVVNTEYDAGLRPEDVTSWDLSELLNPILGEDWWQWWERRDWLWALAPAVPGAIGGIEALRRGGHTVEIVTAKPRWAEAQMWRWIGKWRPAVNRVTIGEARPPMRKSEHSSAYLLVDDKLENCVEWDQAGREALMFARPHNQETRLRWEQAGGIVVEDWKEVLEWVNKLA